MPKILDIRVAKGAGEGKPGYIGDQKGSELKPSITELWGSIIVLSCLVMATSVLLGFVCSMLIFVGFVGVMVFNGLVIAFLFCGNFIILAFPFLWICLPRETYQKLSSHILQHATSMTSELLAHLTNVGLIIWGKCSWMFSQ